jgi:hypothetical protein
VLATISAILVVITLAVLRGVETRLFKPEPGDDANDTSIEPR